MLVAGSNMHDINVLKRKLSKSFGCCKANPWYENNKRQKNCKLTLSQGENIEKVLQRFRMQNAKPVSTPLAIHFKLSKEMCPKT